MWGGVHPDTLEIHVLLHWKGQNQPRYYVLNNFESSEGGEGQEGQEGEGEEGEEGEGGQEGQMRLGEELQEAMKEAELSKQQGGSGIVIMKYPFLSPKERQERMNQQGEGDNGEGETDGDGGYEQENDSVFWVEPPPPPNPEK